MPGASDERIKQVARAIARAHYLKLNMLNPNYLDAEIFASDWWHYFMAEAEAACEAYSHWRRARILVDEF